MANIDGVSVEETENGVSLTVDAWKIWQQLTEDQKYLTIFNEAHHDMFERCVKHGLAEGAAGQYFNRALYDLRQMILTDDELVDGMFVSLTKEFAKIVERVDGENTNLRLRNQQLADELRRRNIPLPEMARA